MMKTYWQVFVAVILLSIGPSHAFAQKSNKAVNKELSPRSFQVALAKIPHGILLDVRTPEEYAEKRLVNAQNVDYKSADFKTQVNNLDKSKPYFVYCKGGVRSAKAANIMKQLGFKRIYTLEGGIDEWEDEGLPVQKK